MERRRSDDGRDRYDDPGDAREPHSWAGYRGRADETSYRERSGYHRNEAGPVPGRDGHDATGGYRRNGWDGRSDGWDGGPDDSPDRGASGHERQGGYAGRRGDDRDRHPGRFGGTGSHAPPEGRGHTGGRPTGPGPGRPPATGPGRPGGPGHPGGSGRPGGASGTQPSAADYADQPTPPPNSIRRPPFGGPGGFAVPSAASAPPPPPERGENWLGWVAFLVGIAVLAGAAGYALNRVTAGSAGAPAARPTPTSSATIGGPGTGPTDPAGGVPGQATGPTAEQVAIMLAGNGLPLRTTVVYTAQNDPDSLLGRPGGYSSRIAFSDARISASEIAGAPPDAVERGGAIEVFGDPAAAQARGSRLSAPGAGGDLPAEYTFVQGRVVLRLSMILPEAMASAYRAALAQVGGGS
ncbi:hypothetical protein [Parafrankia sp. FMc2]|uniref:hypothetical protein n=1 Tax=Parafrankia sp. FMc2 TaxID=3233196 RepID=UPI0034D464B2